MNTKYLSIVIPTQGDLKKLNTIVSSIYKNILNVQFEIIIVCNPEVLNIEILTKKYDQLQIIQLKKAGLNVARQAGLLLSQFELVLFLDDDCELTSPLQIDLLYNEIIQSSELFAVGGYYSLPADAGVWSKVYFNQQMQWLKSGIYDHQKNYCAYLIGGYFILNKSKCKALNLEFDEKMIFGGTEKEFFLQAYKKNQKMRLVDSIVKHHSDDSVFKYLSKTFKQGRGQKYIESKGLIFRPVYLILKFESKSIFFDLAYWSGYFWYDYSIIKLFYFLGSKILTAINEKKISFLNQFKKDL